MEKFNVGILYLGLHNQLVKKFGANSEISRKEFFTKLGKHGQIPMQLRPIVIKEMEVKGLIKRVNRDVLRILAIEIDIERDCNKLYQIAGLLNDSK